MSDWEELRKLSREREKEAMSKWNAEFDAKCFFGPGNYDLVLHDGEWSYTPKPGWKTETLKGFFDEQEDDEGAETAPDESTGGTVERQDPLRGRRLG